MDKKQRKKEKNMGKKQRNSNTIVSNNVNRRMHANLDLSKICCDNCKSIS